MGRMRFECKTLLKLKIPEKDNIMGLSWEKYELLSCDYQFHKNINRDGEVFSDLRGGLVAMSIIGEPSDELLAWMFDHTKKYNGEVTVMDTSERTMEQVYFEDARLVYLFIHYRAEDKPNTVTELKMAVNVEVSFEGDECQEVVENFRFKTVADFLVGNMTKNSPFLKELDNQKAFYNKMVKQLRSNKIMQRALQNPDAKAGFIEALQALLAELESYDVKKVEE